MQEKMETIFSQSIPFQSRRRIFLHIKALNIEIDVSGYRKCCLYYPILLFLIALFKKKRSMCLRKKKCNFVLFIALALLQFFIDLIEGWKEKNLFWFYFIFSLNVVSPLTQQYLTNFYLIYILTCIFFSFSSIIL